MYAIQILLPINGKDNTAEVYNSIISSIIGYACPLFVGMSQSSNLKIDKLQKEEL